MTNLSFLPNNLIITFWLCSGKINPRIYDQNKWNDNPEDIHENNIKPKIQRMIIRSMTPSLHPFHSEIQNTSIELSKRDTQLQEKPRRIVLHESPDSKKRHWSFYKGCYCLHTHNKWVLSVKENTDVKFIDCNKKYELYIYIYLISAHARNYV